MEPGKLIKVAVFPASSEVGMEVIRCLSDHKDIEVIGVDSEPGPAKHICENYIDSAPWLGHGNVVKYFSQFEYVYPTNEYALSTLHGLPNLVAHPSETILLCSNKQSTYSYFKDKIPVPDVYPSHIWEKPQTGHSGKGQKEIISPNILCEYLPGDEFTVDCFTQNGRLLYSQARTRGSVKSGISCHSKSVYEPDTLIMAERINLNLEFTGSWFFQCKRSATRELKLLEIGARIAGSSGLSRALGINLPLLHIYAKMGVDVEIQLYKKAEITRHLTVKSEFPKVSKIYFDWDDTIMIKGKINWKAIALAYKLGIECHILTRKENAQLIPPFQSIIVSENKAEFSTKDTLLIDDSFAERKQWINALSPQQIDLYL